MSVSYSVSARKNPAKPQEAPKFYAQVQATDECTFDVLTRAAADRSTVTSADAKAVMDNVMNIAKEKLASGQIVRINDLGSFRLAISTEGVESADKFTAANIKKARIVFVPCKELKDIARHCPTRKPLLLQPKAKAAPRTVEVRIPEAVEVMATRARIRWANPSFSTQETLEIVPTK